MIDQDFVAVQDSKLLTNWQIMHIYSSYFKTWVRRTSGIFGPHVCPDTLRSSPLVLLPNFRNSLSILICIILVVLSFNALASELLLDEKQEKRARALFETVRCPSCEGQAIKDSGASIARILRENIRSQIVAGQSDQDIIANLKSSYGESIVFMPEGNFATLSLWLIPLLILILSLGKFLLRLLPAKQNLQQM